MTRHYGTYCWNVRLTFRCGCVEYTATEHRCGPDRSGCTRWQTNRTTDKECDVHRGEEGGGLHGGRSSFSSRTSSPPSSSSPSSSSSSSPSSSSSSCSSAAASLWLASSSAGAAERGTKRGERWVEGAGTVVGGGWEGYYVRRRM